MSTLAPNCSLCEECGDFIKLNNSDSSRDVCFFIVIAIFLLIMLSIELKFKTINISELKSTKILQFASLVVLLLTTLPFTVVLILTVILYKVICSQLIKKKDRRFVEFLDIFDVFHSLEDKSTTNIQGELQSTTIELAVNIIKEKLHDIFAHHINDRIFYRRNEEYGFYYWRRYSFIDLSQYVQIVEVPDADEIQNKERVANKIKYNDEGLFKVFIVKNSKDDNEKKIHKVIFKFHHSVKDAAVRDFVKLLLEKTDDYLPLVTSESKKNNSPKALINMITKLCVMLSRIQDDINEIKQDSSTDMNILRRMKTEMNLSCRVKENSDNVYNFNVSEVLEDTIDEFLSNMQR